MYVFQCYSLNTPHPLLPSPHPWPDVLWPFLCGPSLMSACMPVQQTRHYHFIVRILPLSPQPLLFLPKSWSFAPLSPLTPADDVHLQLQIQKLYYTVTYCQSRALASGRPGWGFPGGASGKEPPANAGDVRDEGSIPELERSPGGGHDHPLQYPCLENSMDRGAWWATIYRVAKCQIWLKWQPTCMHADLSENQLY